MRNWRMLDPTIGTDFALRSDVHSTAFVLNLRFGRNPSEWWVSGANQHVKSFGPYFKIGEAKAAAEMLQAQGLLG
jgi:hypothetical protein